MCLYRYDVRNRLEDKKHFGLKSNLPHRPTAEEVELEEELDYERYLALERDDIRVAEQEGEEGGKREREREREGEKCAVYTTKHMYMYMLCLCLAYTVVCSSLGTLLIKEIKEQNH